MKAPPLRVLVMGLPQTGKTTVSKELGGLLSCPVFDADEVRKAENDWDFSMPGRERQAERMRALCDAQSGISIASFVCPTEKTRAIFDPHYTICMQRDGHNAYPDTTAVFEPPNSGACFIHMDRFFTTPLVEQDIKKRLPQGYMIGRFQPWHNGHQALAEEVIRRHGLVTIHVRETQRNDKNPYSSEEVFASINKSMEASDVPSRFFSVVRSVNVAGVYYGRDVGYAVEKIKLPENIEKISATEIRAKRNPQR